MIEPLFSDVKNDIQYVKKGMGYTITQTNEPHTVVPIFHPIQQSYLLDHVEYMTH